MLKKLILISSLVFANYANASIFVSAHPDDAQLFMGQHIIDDLRGNNPTIFILVTSGDAGAGRGSVTQGGAYGQNNFGNSYGSVRVMGHVDAIKFAMSVSGIAVPQAVNSTEVIAGKTVDVVTIGNVKAYNLYLPDGNFDGGGFANDGNESLQKLYNGQINNIRSLGSAINQVYTKQDLINVLAGIVGKNGNSVSKWVNLQESDSTLSPNDHSDHAHTSLFMQAALQSYPCFNKAFFVDYDIANRQINLNAEQIQDKYAMWGALNVSLTNGGNPTSYNSGHNKWLSREYLRTQASSGSCSFSASNLSPQRLSVFKNPFSK